MWIKPFSFHWKKVPPDKITPTPSVCFRDCGHLRKISPAQEKHWAEATCCTLWVPGQAQGHSHWRGEQGLVWNALHESSSDCQGGVLLWLQHKKAWKKRIRKLNQTLSQEISCCFLRKASLIILLLYYKCCSLLK